MVVGSVMQDEPRDDEISRKAFALWEEEGRLHGRDLDHWLTAAAMASAGPPTGTDPASVPRARPAAAHAATGTPHVPTNLRGHIDVADRSRIAGWVQDVADPDRPVEVVLTIDGVETDRMVASVLRPDLARARIGDGRHGYEIIFGGRALPEGPHVLDLVDAATGAAIPGDRQKLAALALQLA